MVFVKDYFDWNFLIPISFFTPEEYFKIMAERQGCTEAQAYYNFMNFQWSVMRRAHKLSTAIIQCFVFFLFSYLLNTYALQWLWSDVVSNLKQIISVHTGLGNFLYVNIVAYLLYAVLFAAAVFFCLLSFALVVYDGLISMYNRLTPSLNSKVGTPPSDCYTFPEISNF